MGTNSQSRDQLNTLFPIVSCALAGLIGFLLALGSSEVIGNDLTITPANDAISEPAADSSYASIKSIEWNKIVEYSNQVDELVEKQLKTNKEKRNEKIDDEIFLRRIYLDAIGRIPNLEETQSFLASESKTKRQDLIDDLLDSYGYTSRQFNFWADTLRTKTRINNSVGQPYIDFVKDSLETNKPYDKFVRELITSSGPVMQRGNGAVGYYLRDLNMPEDNMSNTIRIFLGTRLECAQCHDHPFDKWTQRQYFEMVAFTGGMDYRNDDLRRKYQSELRKIQREKDDSGIDDRLYAVVRNFVRTLNSGVKGSGTGLARLPEGFLGEDGKEGDIVTAKTMFEGKTIVDAKPPKSKQRKARKKRKQSQQIPGATPVGSREAFANWLTEPSNPRFAKVVSNRLWKQVFGLGLVEPIDVFEDSTVASNPELMDFLAEVMIDLDYDMKQFLRVLYNTRTYQSKVTQSDITEPHKYNFNGPIMRRMSAEQIWDSMLGLAVDNLDVRREQTRPSFRYMGDQSVADIYEKTKDMSLTELIDYVDQRINSGKKNMRDGGSMMSNQQSKSEREQKRKAARAIKQFNKKIAAARRKGDMDRVKEITIERAQFVSDMRKSSRGDRYVRASELTSPAPAGHFLREFGQSDREQIDNANSDPAVTQVLMMMNGFIDSKIGRDQNSVMMQNVLSIEEGPDVVDTIFLTMLNRHPTPRERRDWLSEFSEDKKEAYTDLIWTLANSNEFIFVR